MGTLGTLSDKISTPLGRRRPWIMIGQACTELGNPVNRPTILGHDVDSMMTPSHLPHCPCCNTSHRASFGGEAPD